MATPVWSAARAGLSGDTGAVDASAQLNQLLGTHADTVIRRGAAVVTPNGLGGTDWAYHLDSYDLAQPFTMSGTTIGRVVLPALPVGTGGDLIVSLYTNSAGVPGTLLQSTRVPASWLTAQSALTGVGAASNVDLVLQDTGNPLATAPNYTFHIGTWAANTTWGFPNVTATTSLVVAGGTATLPGGYVVTAGGLDAGSTVIANVFTYQFLGGTSVALAIAQPSLPQQLDFAAVTSTTNTVICLGGVDHTANETAVVYTASWDGAGTIGAWSQQASLPQPVGGSWFNAATWNDTTVYLVGGSNTGSTVTLNTVYWANIQNGQITVWHTGPSYPYPVGSASVAVIGNMLVVADDESPALSTTNGASNYAPINPDGSLGAWTSGPYSPIGIATGVVNVGSGIFAVGGSTTVQTSDLQSLSFDASGPGTWFRSTYNGTLPNILQSFPAAFATDTDQWQVFYFGPTGGYLTAQLTRTPMLSVPLPVTGLSNAATYHVVLSQPNSDLNDYVRLAGDINVFPGNPTVLTRTKGSATWVAGTSGHAVPMTVYDGSATGPVMHLWEDSGARVVTVVNSTTPNQNVIGVLEATAQPGPVLNMNPSFTSGVLPWVAHGSAVVQSNAFTHGNLPLSAKMTPSGVASLSYIESDQVPVQAGHSYLASAWVYSPTGYALTSLSINWYDTGVYNTTTSTGTVSVAAGVWTQLQFTSAVPAGLSSPTATLAPTESGTPTASAILYVSAATIQDASGPMVSNVNQVTYSGVWPSTTAWPPTGVTQLA